jgi:hypothetical protein
LMSEPGRCVTRVTDWEVGRAALRLQTGVRRWVYG